MSKKLSLLVLGVLLATAVRADWLVTTEGRLIETRGPWKIEGETVVYVDLAGEEQGILAEDVDLEGSAETTALRTGKPYKPPPQPEKPEKGKKASGKKPDIILYTDAGCPQCKSARELLEKLGVDFWERNLSQDRRALRHYNKIAGRGGGVPVIDIAGRVVYRYDPRVIRERIREYLDKKAARDEDDAGGGG